MISPVVIASWGSASIEDIDQANSKVTILQRLVAIACDRALYRFLEMPMDAGFVFLTRFGEQYPVKWATGMLKGPLLGAKEFGNIIHNNAPGNYTITRGLTGPQVTLTFGDALSLAETLLISGECSAILCCEADVLTGARVMVLKLNKLAGEAGVAGYREIKYSAPSLTRFDDEWARLIDG